MRRVWIALLAAAGLAGCATEPVAPPPEIAPPPPPPPPPVAAIVGQGDYHTRTGGHGTCAGESVALMRDTPDFRARMVALYGSPDSARLSATTVKARAAHLGPGGPAPLAASVSCDVMGRFSLPDLQPGSYFLIARVKVFNAEGMQGDLAVMRHLDLHLGETQSVSLAP